MIIYIAGKIWRVVIYLKDVKEFMQRHIEAYSENVRIRTTENSEIKDLELC